MNEKRLLHSIRVLQERFYTLNWDYRALPGGKHNEKILPWPGRPEEDVIICVHKSKDVQEPFHRHDFFYFNYTYQGQYDSLSYKYDNRITIKEHELYAGQPYAGHALCVHNNQETIVIGTLIQRTTFFKIFLPILSTNARLFRFFLNPTTDHFAEEYLHLKLEDDDNIRTLLEMMVVEYTDPQPDTQVILKTLALATFMQIARQLEADEERREKSLPEQLMEYIGNHSSTVSLKELSAHFAYHPNYISSLLRKEFGKSFSEIVLEQRMERALTLLKGTNLSVQEIASLVGYTNSSNFYKAFRECYHASPRDFLAKL